MTVKQFAYLATGIVFAWILLQLPVNILIKFPFAAFSAILGIGLAYFPVSGRPMDVMIGNYIKALIRPTQFIYEKIGGQIYFPHKAPFATIGDIRQYGSSVNPFPKDKLKAYLESLGSKPKSKADEIEKNFLMSISSLTANSISDLNIQQVNPPPPMIANERKIVFPQTITAVQPAAPKPQQDEPALQTIPSAKPSIPIFNGFNKIGGTLSAPDSPNLIIGITKDARGNALTNILVEVKDKDNNPVRAFKTNELGRFASATPLINGIYNIEFEDPRGQNKFKKMTINVAGQIIAPIEAISIDPREELRRSLFKTN